MTYGHSSGLLPQEAPVMIAEKRKLFFSFYRCHRCQHLICNGLNGGFTVVYLNLCYISRLCELTNGCARQCYANSLSAFLSAIPQFRGFLNHSCNRFRCSRYALQCTGQHVIWATSHLFACCYSVTDGASVTDTGCDFIPGRRVP